MDTNADSDVAAEVTRRGWKLAAHGPPRDLGGYIGDSWPFV
jgi:hypothetical protein